MASRAHRLGRPPAGPHGQKTSTYPQISVRLPPNALAVLHAMAAVERRPLWHIVSDSLRVLQRKSRKRSWNRARLS